jgi:t-SNARE complex subunit (syntaxin)
MLNYDEVKERYLEVVEIEKKMTEVTRSNCETLEKVKDLKNTIDKILDRVSAEVLNGG